MTDETEAFGLAFYEALKRHGRGSLITSKLDYAGVQKLKQADRAGTVEAFRGSGYELIQRIKSDTPEELAAYAVEQAQAAEQQAAAVARRC